MKKILRKILVIVFSATLFIVPTQTALAASIPVYVRSDANFDYYEYQDQPYYLAPGESLLIYSLPGGGEFNVPANTYFLLDVEFEAASPVTIEYYRYTPSFHMISGEFPGNIGGYGIVGIPEPSTYMVRVIAGSSPAYIHGYVILRY